MVSQIDALARALENAGLQVDLDGDGRHIEVLWPGAVVFIEVRCPERATWPNLWDHCTMHIDSEQPEVKHKVEVELISFLKAANIMNNQ